MRIVIDLDDSTLKWAQKQADEDNRSRKQWIELLIGKQMVKYYEEREAVNTTSKN